MEQTVHLWLFFVLVFGVVLLPGLDMAYVLASALVGGRRAGLVATAGIVAGGVCHVIVGALGIMTVLRLMPAAFNAVLLAGGLYLFWVGWSLVRRHDLLAAPPATRIRSQLVTFRQGMLTNLLNPKAYLFMLAIFPQFIQVGHGAFWLQAVVLWVIIAVTQTAVYGGVACAGHRVRNWLAMRPEANARLRRAVGGLLLASACYSAYAGLRID